MSWTTPTVRATGDLITASIWNAEIVNDLKEVWREVAYVEFTAIVTANAVAEAAATQIVSAGSVTFDGTTPAVVEFFCEGFAPGAPLTGGINLWDGSTDLGRLFDAVVVQLTTDVPCGVLRRRITPSAGAHTFSARVWTTTATNFNVLAGAGGAGVRLPGHIRIMQKGG